MYWNSRKQQSVARSTPEAEAIAMSSAMFSESSNVQSQAGLQVKEGNEVEGIAQDAVRFDRNKGPAGRRQPAACNAHDS